MTHRSEGTKVASVRRFLENAVKRVRAAGVDTPILDAEVMLAACSQRTRTDILTHTESRLSIEHVEIFESWVERRVQREPLAYIVGEKEFYGLNMRVKPGVLIPRSDTETLAGMGITALRCNRHGVIAEIGLGSGAVALAIVVTLPHVIAYGTDLSEVALEVALENAVSLEVADRVHFFRGDLFQGISGRKYDLVVSNPPYVPSGEIDGLASEIAKYEPREALDGGQDGLSYHRRLASEAPMHLRAGGELMVEVGDGQSSAVMEMFVGAGLQNVRSVTDLNGTERVVTGEKAE